jgi:hypothetical protein
VGKLTLRRGREPAIGYRHIGVRKFGVHGGESFIRFEIATGDFPNYSEPSIVGRTGGARSHHIGISAFGVCKGKKACI